MITAAVVKNPLKKLRLLYNDFVFNLAVADAIVGTIVCPLDYLFIHWDFLTKKWLPFSGKSGRYDLICIIYFVQLAFFV